MMDKNWSKLVPYWFLLFTIGFGWFILAPLVPGILGTFSVSLTLAVLLISVYGYTMVALGLLAGWISAKFTVKAALYSAAIISFIGLLGRALSPNYSILFVFQIIAAVAYPLAMAPVGSISESLFKEKSHSVIGISVGILFFGMAIGAFVGPSIFSAYGLYGAFWVTVILAAIAAVWTFFGIRGYPTFYKGRSLRGTFKVGMIKNWYVGLIIASASVMFGSIASEVLIAEHIAVSAAIAYGGLFGGLAFLGSAIGAMALPPLFEKYRAIRSGLISTSLLAFIFAFTIAYFLPFMPILSLLAVAYFMFGFFGNAFWSMAMASTTNYVSDPAKAGFATSMYSVATNLGVAFVPALLGPLFLVHAYTAVAIVSVMEFAGFLLAFGLKVNSARVVAGAARKRRRKRHKRTR